MGTACSLGVKHSSIGLSGEERMKDGQKKPGSISSSVVYSTLSNPFRISRDDAENLLQGSYAGAFIFSHSITSEIFLSMSTGKYVCHHPIFKKSQRYVIGGRIFNNIEEAVSFYRTNPLGESMLTEQFNSNSLAEAKQHTGNAILNSPPERTQRSNTKRVTFNVPHSKSSTASGHGSTKSVDNTDLQSNTGSSSFKPSERSTEEGLAMEQELIKKASNMPRKSICRIQPEDSLSTSSGNMFKEEF